MELTVHKKNECFDLNHVKSAKKLNKTIFIAINNRSHIRFTFIKIFVLFDFFVHCTD